MEFNFGIFLRCCLWGAWIQKWWVKIQDVEFSSKNIKSLSLKVLMLKSAQAWIFATQSITKQQKFFVQYTKSTHNTLQTIIALFTIVALRSNHSRKGPRTWVSEGDMSSSAIPWLLFWPFLIEIISIINIHARWWRIFSSSWWHVLQVTSSPYSSPH